MAANTTCLLFDDSKQCETVIIVKRIAASLSLLGCFLMLMVIFVYRKVASFVQRMILYMTLATLLSAVAYVMGDTQEEGPFCDFQGFLASIADWSVLIWMFLITLTLYLTIVKEVRVDHREWVFHLGGWVFPILVSGLPFIDNHYGPAGAWCWVDNPYWRFGFWYIPLFIFLVVIIALYSRLVYVVHQRAKNFSGLYSHEAEQSQRIMLEEIKELRAYPFIYLLINICPLINRIQNAVSNNHAVFALTLLHAISISLLGFVNALVFGCNRQTLEDLKWRNFKVNFKNRLSNRRTVVDEYQPQVDDQPIGNEITGYQNDE